jgi:S1-C subfamily serine protease
VLRVRPPAVAALVAAAALLGGVVALGLDRLTDGGSPAAVVTVAPTDPGAAAVPARPRLGNGFDPAALYARRSPGVVTIYADLAAGGTTQGSGFVADGKGRILTNAHVITNVADRPATVRAAERVYVEFVDGERVPATILGWDLFNDVGVVEVDPKVHAVSPVPLGDSSTVAVGTPVAAIGSPFGKQSSLAVGVVSATGRTIDSLTSGFAIADAIQIDAPINRGNSGGPLFDADGRVIGINAQIESQSGTAEGVGFAIPINSARRSLEQLVRNGRVAYAYVGVTTQDVTPGMAEAFGLATRRGALVARVEPGTPAARAGLRGGSRTASYNGIDVTLGGDVVVAIAGAPVRDADDVGRIVSGSLLPGQRVPFTVVRDGRRVRVVVTVGDRPVDRT